MNMNKFLFSFVCFSLALPPLTVQAQEVTVPETAAKNAYIVDFDTGTVLMEKNADEKVPTASMSKVLTTIVVYDALKSGKLTMEQTLPVSERAWAKSDPKLGESTMFLPLGSMAKVEDLIRGVVIQSGNDACVVLAEGVAGSEENFVAMMNEKAAEIGMENSHFMNSTGVDDPNHYSTPRDLATMSVYLIKHYPEDYKYYSEKEFVYNNIKQGNRNPLLYKNIGADGIKTGHTSVAGYGLIGSGTAGGRRIVMVINGTKSMQERADESAKLMSWALTSFKNMDLVKKDAVIAKAPVVLGTAREVEIAAAEDFRATVPSFTKNTAQMAASYQVPLKAPVKAGDKVGTLLVTLANGTTKEIPLVATQDVAEAPFFSRLMEKIMLMVAGTPKYGDSGV